MEWKQLDFILRKWRMMKLKSGFVSISIWNEAKQRRELNYMISAPEMFVFYWFIQSFVIHTEFENYESRVKRNFRIGGFKYVHGCSWHQTKYFVYRKKCILVLILRLFTSTRIRLGIRYQIEVDLCELAEPFLRSSSCRISLIRLINLNLISIISQISI